MEAQKKKKKKEKKRKEKKKRKEEKHLEVTSMRKFITGVDFKNIWVLTILLAEVGMASAVQLAFDLGSMNV